MSNQPEKPQPYTGVPPNYTPPDYTAPVVPPQYQEPQNPYGGQNQQFPAPPYGQQQFQNPQQFPNQQAPPYGAPTYYQGGPGYMGTSGPRGLSLTSMILGLASLVLGAGFFIAPQIVGIVLGHLGLRRENPQGRAFAITGLITNYLALLIWGALYTFLIFSIAIFDSNSFSSY